MPLLSFTTMILVLLASLFFSVSAPASVPAFPQLPPEQTYSNACFFFKNLLNQIHRRHLLSSFMYLMSLPRRLLAFFRTNFYWAVTRSEFDGIVSIPSVLFNLCVIWQPLLSSVCVLSECRGCEVNYYCIETENNPFLHELHNRLLYASVLFTRFVFFCVVDLTMLKYSCRLPIVRSVDLQTVGGPCMDFRKLWILYGSALDMK